MKDTITKGFVKPANPKRLAAEDATAEHIARKASGKPDAVTNGDLYDMLIGVQNTQVYILELLQKQGRA